LFVLDAGEGVGGYVRTQRREISVIIAAEMADKIRHLSKTIEPP
jgi:hypothetical protein